MSLRCSLPLHAAGLAQASGDVRYRRALARPAETQWRLLRRLLRRNAASEVGTRLGFGAIDDPESWRRRVPLVDHRALAPQLAAIRDGRAGVLTAEPVARLMPTGGSTGGRKLLPWTASLAAEFRAALAPWLADLSRRHGELRRGPAYWSLSPAVASEPGPVPIGFDDDSSYLGPLRALLRPTLVAPDALARVGEVATFRYLTALHLLACGDLRLVSVWHPGFFETVLQTIAEHREDLIADLAAGRQPRLEDAGLARALRLPPLPDRAAVLAASTDPRAWWPRLAVVSCWTHGAACGPAAALARRLPQAQVQAKGLLATEGVVTIPYAGRHPLAITSHVYEFIDQRGRCHWPHQLRTGATYEVVLSTGGGLYRYRLGDLVRVTGWLAATPCLRFLRRRGELSDLVGEKLEGDFVAAALARAIPPELGEASLRPRPGQPPGYELLTTRAAASDAQLAALDARLRANPAYAWARDLGQLAAPCALVLPPDTNTQQRLGERKPRALVPAEVVGA